MTTELTEVEVDGRAFALRPVGREVLDAPNVMAAGIAAALGKSYRWGVGFMFADLEQAMELWRCISCISGFDEAD